MYELAKVTFLRVITLAILGAWGIKIFYSRKIEFRRTPLDLSLLIFFLFLIISTIFSLNPKISLIGHLKRHEGLFTWISYLFLFFATINFLIRREQIRRFLTTLALTSIPISTYGIFQHFGLDFIRFAEKTDITRSFSTLGNPVFLGAYLTLIIPLTLSLLIQENSLPKRLLWGGVETLALINLVYTLGRGAWLGTLGALIIFAVFFLRKGSKKYWRVTAILIVAVIVFLLLGILLPSPFPTGKLLLKRAKSLVQWGEGTVATRLEMWESTLSMIRDRPILGYGLENFRDVFPGYRSQKLESLEGEWKAPDRPHNEVLYLASSIGIFGLLAYLGVIFTFLFYSLRYLSKISDFSTRTLLLGSISAIVGYLIQAQFAMSLVGVTPLVWILMGVVISGEALGKEKGTPPLRIRKELFTRNEFLRVAFIIVFSLAVIFLIFFSLRFLVADHYYRLGLVHSLEEEKIKNFEKAVAINPFQNQYRLDLGITYFKKAQRLGERVSLDQAIAVYQEALEFNSRDEDVYYNLGNAYSFYGRATRDQRMLDLALEAYEKAVEIDPLFSLGHWAIGFIYFQKNEPKKGVKHYEEAVKVDPKNAVLWNDIGIAYEDMGKIKKAKESYRKALKLNPNLNQVKERLNQLEKKKK